VFHNSSEAAGKSSAGVTRRGGLIFCEGQHRRLIPYYDHDREMAAEGGVMSVMSWLFVIVSIASIPLAGAMARERARSPRVWLWIAALVGPLAPLALLILGKTRRRAPAS